jgi:transposase
MPRTAEPSQPTVCEQEVVLGVDTHKDVHAAVVLSPLGARLGGKAFPATAAGYGQLLDWACAFGLLRRAGVECTGSYGAALTRHLLAAGIEVLEVNEPDKAIRRRRGKTDAIDAEAAARAVLSGRAGATAKTGDGPVEMARMFRLAKASAVKARTQAINQLRSVLVTAAPAVREPLAGLGPKTLFRRCAGLTSVTPAIDVTTAAVHTLRVLGSRILRLSEEISELEQLLTTVIQSHTPRLLQRIGIGPDSAAALLITAGDNPDRMGGEASFAALCGVSPVEKSSGKTERRRLNHGGDRQANAALYRIVLTRLRWDPATRAYLDRRIREGKTRREVIRCLKRYVAREIYPLLRPTHQAPTAA